MGNDVCGGYSLGGEGQLLCGDSGKGSLAKGWRVRRSWGSGACASGTERGPVHRAQGTEAGVRRWMGPDTGCRGCHISSVAQCRGPSLDSACGCQWLL